MAFIGILLGMSASIMMQTILATVLPQVVRELGVPNFTVGSLVGI